MYRIIEEKVATVEVFLTEFESDPDHVRALADWDWIEEEVQGPPAHIAA